MTKRIVVLLLLIIIFGGIVFVSSVYKTPSKHSTAGTSNTGAIDQMGGLIKQEHPLSITYMRRQQYPGSDILIEETLPAGSNYNRYLVSYKSEGLKIYALLTIPQGERPKTGWPVILFNHRLQPLPRSHLL